MESYHFQIKRLTLILVLLFLLVCWQQKELWIEKASMPTARMGLTTSVLNGKIYAIGGALTVSPHPAVSTVEVYILPEN